MACIPDCTKTLPHTQVIIVTKTVGCLLLLQIAMVARDKFQLTKVEIV